MDFKKIALKLLAPFLISWCFSSQAYAQEKKEEKQTEDGSKKKEYDKNNLYEYFMKESTRTPEESPIEKIMPGFLDDFLDDIGENFNKGIEERAKQDFEISPVKNYVSECIDKTHFDAFVRQGKTGTQGWESEVEYSNELERELRGIGKKAFRDSFKKQPIYRNIKDYFSVDFERERLDLEFQRTEDILSDEDEKVINPQKFNKEKYFWEEIVDNWTKFNTGARIRINKTDVSVKPKVTWADFYTATWENKKEELTHKVSFNYKKLGVGGVFSSRRVFKLDKNVFLFLSYVTSEDSIARVSSNYDFESGEWGVFGQFYIRF